jgi:hypothetical protein
VRTSPEELISVEVPREAVIHRGASGKHRKFHHRYRRRKVMSRLANAAILQSAYVSAACNALNRSVTSALGVAQNVKDKIGNAYSLWRARRALALRDAGRSRKEWEVRQLEEFYVRATDLHDLERMERNWDRRDGGGLRAWD